MAGWWRWVVGWVLARVGGGVFGLAPAPTPAAAPVVAARVGVWACCSVWLGWFSAWAWTSSALALLGFVLVAGLGFVFRDRLSNARATLKTAVVFLEFTPALLRTVLSRCDESLGAGWRALESSLVEVMGRFLYDSGGVGEKPADDAEM